MSFWYQSITSAKARFMQQMEYTETCRVLSIQSHVVSGYVGNDSATFLLQVSFFLHFTLILVERDTNTGFSRCSGTLIRPCSAAWQSYLLKNVFILEVIILSYCLAVTCTRSHVIVMIDIRRVRSIWWTFNGYYYLWHTIVILCGDVCFSEVFRMRAVLFSTAGQEIRIHWWVVCWVINQWLKNLVLEICIYCFCYSNL